MLGVSETSWESVWEVRGQKRLAFIWLGGSEEDSDGLTYEEPISRVVDTLLLIF
jgi:hypothetical protein